SPAKGTTCARCCVAAPTTRPSRRPSPATGAGATTATPRSGLRTRLPCGRWRCRGLGASVLRQFRVRPEGLQPSRVRPLPHGQPFLDLLDLTLLHARE